LCTLLTLYPPLLAPVYSVSRTDTVIPVTSTRYLLTLYLTQNHYICVPSAVSLVHSVNSLPTSACTCILCISYRYSNSCNFHWPSAHAISHAESLHFCTFFSLPCALSHPLFTQLHCVSCTETLSHQHICRHEYIPSPSLHETIQYRINR